MVIKVNPPPQIKLPKAFADDPEIREYFRQHDRFNLQLWRRTGGGSDFVDDANNTATESNTAKISNLSNEIEELRLKHLTANNSHLIERIEELEATNRRLENGPLIRRIEELEAASRQVETGPLIKRIEELEATRQVIPVQIPEVEPDTRYIAHIAALRAEIDGGASYEEGTWTPVLTDVTNDATSSVAVGTYTKIGRMVHVKGRLVISSLGSVSGAVQISGLPFSSSSTANTDAVANFGVSTVMAIAQYSSISGWISTNSTNIRLVLWDTTLGPSNLQHSEWTAAGAATFEATYYT